MILKAYLSFFVFFTADNVSLKSLDISWNNIGREGGVKLCECLKVKQ